MTKDKEHPKMPLQHFPSLEYDAPDTCRIQRLTTDH